MIYICRVHNFLGKQVRRFRRIDGEHLHVPFGASEHVHHPFPRTGWTSHSDCITSIKKCTTTIAEHISKSEGRLRTRNSTLEGIQNISKYSSSLLTHRPWHCSFITLQSMRTFMIFMSICRISARIATWQIFEQRVFPTTHVGRWRQLQYMILHVSRTKKTFRKQSCAAPVSPVFVFSWFPFFYISISSLNFLFFQSCNLYHTIAQNYRKRVLRNVWAHNFLQRLWFVFVFLFLAFLGLVATPPPPQKTHLFSFKHEFVFRCFSALFNVPCSCSQKNQQIKVTRDKVWRIIFVLLL